MNSEILTDIDRFVGRTRELGVLDDAVAAARSGEGCLVLVSGEAGIGKTRFCREVATRAERNGYAVAWGSCWPDGGAPPLWPWQSVLNTLVGPAAAALLSDDRGGVTVDPERFVRFAAVAERMAAACARSPALVVIDDVHAADAGALLLTRFVARTLARLPLVLLLARRCTGGEAAQDHAARDLENAATLLSLSRFDRTEVTAFLRARGQAALGQDLLTALLRLTGGLPLHLDRVVVLGSADGAIDGAPGSVEAAIAAAIDRLSAGSRELLSRAALLGSSPVVSEAAAVSRVSPAAVRAALAEATALGLASVAEPERFAFSHDLVRETLRARLSGEELVQAHARAAETLARAGRAGAGQLARLAHHALGAASRSGADAGRAVEACRAAARAMVGEFDYEQAAALLAAAATAQDDAGLPEPVAPLLVEWAEAVLQCGRLAEARQLFDRAANAATAEGDPVILARAAVGLGGVWVNEHRTQLEWERVVGLQRRALAALPDGEERLRHRLVMRLAVEDVYRGGPVEPVLAGLDAARALGDGHVLAEALSLCHHALLTPRHLGRRLSMADELIAVASPAGAGMLALVGLCWRTVDLFHLGDKRAERSLAELRERADAVGCKSVGYIAAAIDVMCLIRAGRLDEAEAKAYACLDLGTQVGDADALGFFGAHLTTIRWLQARDAEVLETVEQIAGSPTLNPAEFAFEATVASLAARCGQTEKARVVLDRLTPPGRASAEPAPASSAPGLADLPQSSSWLAGMLAIVETARVLGDAGLARQAYQLLTPYADQPIMPSLAVTCLGSVQRALGVAAVTFGDLDRAVEHLDRAVTANRLLGNRPVTAIAAADLADALLSRQGRDDRERALRLLAQAGRDADTMGMPARAAGWKQRLADLTDETATIYRQRGHWTLTIGDRQAVVPDRLGVRYLAQLLINPNQPTSAMALAGNDVASAAARSGRQPVLDDGARASYRRRVRELTDELASADARGDGPASQRLRADLDALLLELRRSTGRGGRVRSFPDAGERARTAVRKAIKRAIDELTSAEPAIGQYLQRTITTGTECCYTPDPRRPIRWTHKPRGTGGR